jgi:hypothetical protein
MKKIFLSLVVLGVIFVGTVSAVDKTTVTINDMVVRTTTKILVVISKEISFGPEHNVAFGEGLINKSGVLTVDLKLPVFTKDNDGKDRFRVSSNLWGNDGSEYYIMLFPNTANYVTWNDTTYFTGNGLKPIKYSLKGNSITFSYNDFKDVGAMNAPFFDGEFRNAYDKYSDEVYVFTGNRYQYTSKSQSESGTYELKGGEIIFYNEKGKKWRTVTQYVINDLFLRVYISNNNTPTYLKPFGEFINSGKLVTQFQGTWTNSNDPNVSYTFSGNKFVFTNSKKNTVEGTIEANSRIIKLTAPDGYAMMTYEFKDGKLYFGWIMSTVNKEWWYGPFDLKK